MRTQAAADIKSDKSNDTVGSASEIVQSPSLSGATSRDTKEEPVADTLWGR